MATPTYLEAAATHNIAADADKGIFDTLGDMASSVVNFTGLSVAAGVNEVYNIVPTVGNWLGADMQQSKLEDRIREYDDDLLKYYQDHQQGIDTTGFVLGSVVPGMAGMKVLNVGQVALRGAIQSGKFGATTGQALGLLAPSRQKYISQAISQLDEAGSVFKMTEANAIKALGAGFGEQALNAFAWETAVAVTMNKSPVLDDMSLKDLAWNLGVGTVLGGAIGGALIGAGTAWSLKKAASNIQTELSPWAMREAASPNLSAMEKAFVYRNAIDNIPEVPADFRLAGRATAMRSSTTESLWLKVREELGAASGGDQEVAQTLFEAFKTSKSDDIMQTFLHAKSVGRISSTSHLEAEIAKLAKKPALEMTAEEAERFRNTAITHLRVWGDDAGTILDERPALISLADRFKSLSVDERGVYANGKLVFGQENNPHRAFNILNLDHRQVEARYLWAEKLPAWKQGEDIFVHADDIPLLEKALRDGVAVKVIPSEGQISKAVNMAGSDLDAFVRRQKLDVANRLTAVSQSSPEVIADKLRAFFGVDINLVDDASIFGRWMRKTEQGTAWEAIEMSRTALSQKNLMNMVRTLEHERGHSMFNALMRGLGGDKTPIMRKGIGIDYVDQQFAAVVDRLRPELMTLSKRVRPGHWANARWNPGTKEYLTQAHELMADSFSYFAKNPEQLDKFPEFKAYAGHLIKPIPQEIKDALTVRASKATQEEIAKIVNVRKDILTGAQVSDDAWFARDSFRKEFLEKTKQAGTRAGEAISDPLMRPQHIKVVQDTQGLTPNGYELDGMTFIAQKEKLFAEEARRNVAMNLGEEAAGLPHWGQKELATGTGEGAGFFTFANGNYGTGGSLASYIGQRTHALIKKAKDATLTRLAAPVNKLLNDEKSAIEWSVLNEKARISPYRYILDPQSGNLVAKLSPEELAKAVAAGDEYAVLPIKNEATRAVVKEHMAANAGRTGGLARIRNAEGIHFRRDAAEFYPIPRNPADTPHFAFVVDDSITGVGHSQMIYAASETELETLKQAIRAQRPGLKILTKAESEAYHKAYGQFSFEEAINERLFDVSKIRSGTSASFLPKTDPTKIVQETLDWHLARDASYVRENVRHLYAKQFAQLTAAGESLTQSAKSKFGYISPLAHAESQVSNPPLDLMRMALDVNKLSEFPLWNLQRRLDEKVSAVWRGFTDSFRAAKSDADLEAIGQALRDSGYGGALQMTDKLYEASNKTIERGMLSSFVNKANALISTFALRLDMLNAVNNAVGSQVLLNTELRSLMANIAKGNQEAAGELGKLAFITAPGTNKAMLSHGKLISNAIGNFHKPELRAWAKQHGFVSSISEQYNQSLDIMATAISNGKVSDAFTKLKKLADQGEIWTGNKLAEEFNRFVAADVMRQVTDIGVKYGVLQDSREALAYINTFVNRTQGNYLASQRPLVFQGPVGQAIGLFQTYQFNLLQQLFRYVGEGEAKSALLMMGLQGSIYGMQGLPAFNAINTHILGNAAGNTQHTDIYKTIYSGAGKEAGDWLLYGGASNVLGLIHPDLRSNIYTRGDINPRHLFVIPTSPEQLPIYTTVSRLTNGLMQTAGNIMKGGAVGESLLRGLEHNGLSRPLTGIAQLAEAAYSGKGVRPVSKSGNLLMAHDLASLASLTRLAGGKPLDEALVQDAMFRFTAYRAADRERRNNLGEAVKMNILSGKDIEQDALESFAESYHKAGGKQTEFAQFMARQYRNTTETQAEQLRNKLSSPYSKHLQNLMGADVNGGEVNSY